MAVAALLLVVSRQLAMRRQGARHLRECRVGQWVDGHSGGAGASCSSACLDAAGAYLLGQMVLGVGGVREIVARAGAGEV